QQASTKWRDAKEELRLAQLSLDAARDAHDSARISRAERLVRDKSAAEGLAHFNYDEAKAARQRAEQAPSPPQRLVDARAQAVREGETARARLGEAREELALAQRGFDTFMQSDEAQPVRPALDPILAARLATANERLSDAQDDLAAAKKQLTDSQRALDQAQ